MAVEYLDAEIANEGQSANNWVPGAWTNATVVTDEESQPDMDPPHINDYAAFKKHKNYAKYFRPYRYQPFPAFMYGPGGAEKIVKTKDEVIALGPDWSPTPPESRTKQIDMTGKSLPVKSDTQRLAEVIAAQVQGRQPASGAIDPTTIASIVAAVMAALPQNAAPMPAVEPVEPETDIERQALIELADKNSVKIDKRWGNARIKAELGLD